MRGVGLNELVIMKHGWVGNSIEQFVSVGKIESFCEFGYKKSGEVCAVSESVGVYFSQSQLVHKKVGTKCSIDKESRL